jgi:hypothetical protein
MQGFRAHRTVLGCESLEGRDCPAIYVFGSYMAVVGTPGADTVSIADDGSGHVTATLNGTTKTADGIHAVAVATFGGNDTIDYTLGGTQGGRSAVAVDAGAGDDAVTLTAGDVGGQFAFLGFGAQGNDTITASVGGVAPGAFAAVALSGGRGDDTINATATGTYDGAFVLGLLGGLGNDTITGNITADAGSTGDVRTAASGGVGDDALTLNVAGGGATGLNSLYAVMDGGPGTDTGTATDNVTKRHVEM